MTEMQKAMLALYRACKNQYNSKDSCRGCLLVDAESIELAGGDDYFSTCEANYPKVWDVFHTWLKENDKTGDSAETSVKKYGRMTMTDKEAIECADKLGTYCRGKDCEECPFYDSYNDCTLELERPGMWDLEYLLKEGEDDEGD